AATSAIAREASRWTADGSLWSHAPIPLHPSGLPGGERGTCGSCHWRYEQRGRSRCRQLDESFEDAKQRTVDPGWFGCERFEDALDCLTCGACCREAYHSVEVKRRDPFIKKQPAYLVDRTTYLEVLREGDRCAALHGGSGAYSCVIYDDRPKTCRDFTLGSDHCLTARRRVGLSLYAS
ncbi:MAG: YkgJ family cysteine cluster protein, partial [Proteobacteria bacterium]|nr:YkgJ family cysteine cluster protein [Pseudomonadota bacterium]